MELSLILPEIIICMAALFVLTGELFISEDSRKILGLVSALGSVIAIGALLKAGSISQSVFSDLFVIDSFSQVIKGILLVGTTLIILLSVDYAKHKVTRRGEYYSLILFSVLGMMFMASSQDFISFFLSLQLTSIPLYILSGFDKDDAKSNEAAYKYLMLGLLAAVIMLYGMTLVYGLTGSTQFINIAAGLKQLDFLRQPGLLMAMLFIFVGFAFKIAAVPFHFWVPDTYEGAPTPVTSFLATAPKVAGFAALMRFVTAGFQPLIGQWRVLFIILSILSMFIGNVVALSQTNIKRMLGFSSVAHVGYILMAFAVADRFAYSAAIFYLMIYGTINIGAFAVVAAVSKGDYNIETIARICREHPFMSISMAVFLISMIGIPPSPGFWGKFDLFASAINKGMAWLAVIGIINSVISVYYYFNVLRHIYVERHNEDPEGLIEGQKNAAVAEANIPLMMRLVVGLALAITILIAVYPQPFIEIARAAANALRI